MGIDALDTLFRLEKSFGVKFDKGFWDRMPREEGVEPARWWEAVKTAMDESGDDD